MARGAQEGRQGTKEEIMVFPDIMPALVAVAILSVVIAVVIHRRRSGRR
jgi:hypothetical protein